MASRTQNLPAITVEDGYCIPANSHRRDKWAMVAGWERGLRGVDRLRANILATASDGCWVWPGYQLTSNAAYPDHKYGRCYGPKSKLGDHFTSGALAHRAAYIIFKGDIPDGMTVDHICFNPLCVNPDHLQLLTRAENSARKNPVNAATRGQSVPSEE